jgi:hypothetical protein
MEVSYERAQMQQREYHCDVVVLKICKKKYLFLSTILIRIPDSI